MNIDRRLEKAERCLKTAALASADDDHDAACNRAYYAMFNAARAALLALGQHDLAMAKTHSGLIAAFGEHLVKSGKLPVELGRSLAMESKRRLIGDYGGDSMSSSDADPALLHATAFVEAISSWLTRGGAQAI